MKKVLVSKNGVFSMQEVVDNSGLNLEINNQISALQERKSFVNNMNEIAKINLEIEKLNEYKKSL